MLCTSLLYFVLRVRCNIPCNIPCVASPAGIPPPRRPRARRTNPWKSPSLCLSTYLIYLKCVDAGRINCSLVQQVPSRYDSIWKKSIYDQGHREFPFGNSREFPGIADPKIPGGNSREFLKFLRELRGISRVLSFFPIFIVDYDILAFNLTAFWAKPWMTSLTQLFNCAYRVPV